MRDDAGEIILKISPPTHALTHTHNPKKSKLPHM